MNNYKMENLLYAYGPLQACLKQGPDILTEVVEGFLKKSSEQAHLNAFVRIYAEEARARAQTLVTHLKAGEAGPLAGMVVGIKDLFCYEGHPVQAGSRILEGFVSQLTSTAVERLIGAGAIILGHQNCDQFGMGSSNETSVYGPVSNALNTNRTSGGSSGGSAVAVQANMCHISLGTDTGGSVRQPAAFCGLVGLKPTYSRISRFGLVAYSSSFDTVSVLANTVADCAAALQVMAGVDEKDNTSARCPVPAYPDHLSWQGKQAKVAYFKNALSHPGLQKEVKEKTLRFLDQLKAKGHEVVGIDFPLLAYALPTYYILTTAEATANLARYDGVRFGFRAPGEGSLQEMMRKTRTLGFGDEVKRRLLLGAFVLGSNYYDSYYTKAQKVRRLIKETMEKLLTSYDYLISPTTPTTAFFHGSTKQDPLSQYLADLFTVPASVAGLPAISIPNGCDEKGLPIGLQVIAPAFQEEKLLSFSQYLLDHCST